MRIYILSLLTITFFCCQNSTQNNGKKDTQEESKDTVATFGADFKPQQPLTAQQLPQKIGDQKKYTAQLQGTVKEVCQKKGCWMTLPLNDSTDLRVTFKDYGFFVPKDISGRQVVLEGYAYYDTLSVKMRKHLAKDAGKPQAVIDSIQEPQTQLAYKATGVRLLPEEKAR